MANEAIKNLIDNIGTLADDLATLEVYTFTGTLSTMPTDVNNGRIKWGDLAKTAATDGTLKLVAATKVYPDADSDYFQAEDANAELVTAHLEAVKAATTARLEFLQLVGKIIGL